MSIRTIRNPGPIWFRFLVATKWLLDWAVDGNRMLYLYIGFSHIALFVSVYDLSGVTSGEAVMATIMIGWLLTIVFSPILLIVFIVLLACGFVAEIILETLSTNTGWKFGKYEPISRDEIQTISVENNAQNRIEKNNGLLAGIIIGLGLAFLFGLDS